jgi:glycosyltransferase involved in cell wall biosynthesis
VLHVVQNLNYGGMERLIAEMARRVDRERFEPHVLCLQYVGRFGREIAGVAGVHLCGPLPRWSLLRPAALAREIARIAPDVVHSHSGVWLKAATAARMAGVPRVVHTEHGRRFPDPLSDRLIDRTASRRTDVVVAVSDALARHLRLRVTGGRARVVAVPNGVGVDAFRPGGDGSALRAELGIPADAPILGSIGRLEPVKGYDVMVRAMASLVHRSDDARPRPVLVLAGDGSERGRLEELARAMEIGDRVRFLGWRDDVHALHAAFGVFTLSSHSEGTSVSLLEAMSAGICPVVTDVGGNAAVLGTGLRHRLVAPAHPEALANAWAAALADARAREADGRAARARVAERFSLETMVAAYESLYAGPLPRPAAVSHLNDLHAEPVA